MTTQTQAVALVTGGSRSIGAAIAKHLAKDGFTVALTYNASPTQAREVVAEIEQGGGRALAIQADAADPQASRRAVEEVVRTYGRLDVLVNNAGVGGGKPIGDTTLDELQQLLAVNVTGVFATTQKALEHMQSGARIINIGSTLSARVPFTGSVAYTLTKGAVASFNRALARELGPRGITVNAVLPGPTDTAMNPHDGPGAATMHAAMALKRHLSADEVASAVAYLARPEASGITGAELLVDGGFAV